MSSSYTLDTVRALAQSDVAQAARGLPSMMLGDFLNTTQRDCGLALQIVRDIDSAPVAAIESLDYVCGHFSALTHAIAINAIPTFILDNIRIDGGSLADLLSGGIHPTALTMDAQKYLPELKAILSAASATYIKQMGGSPAWQRVGSLCSFLGSMSGDTKVWAMSAISRLAFIAGLAFLGWNIWCDSDDAAEARTAPKGDDAAEARTALKSDDIAEARTALEEDAVHKGRRRQVQGDVCDWREEVGQDGTTRRIFDCLLRSGSDVWRGVIAENTAIVLGGYTFRVDLRWELRDKPVYTIRIDNNV